MPECAERIVGWASAAWPLEACGFLLGREGAVLDVTLESNVASSPLTGFAIAPLATLAAATRAGHAGLEIVGVWHSHPADACEPSHADELGNPFGIAWIVWAQPALPSAAAAFFLPKSFATNPTRSAPTTSSGLSMSLKKPALSSSLPAISPPMP